MRRSESFTGYVPDFAYHLIALRDLSTEGLLDQADAVGTLLYLVHPFKSENFFEAADRVRLFMRRFPDDEMEVLGRHFGVYLQMLAEKEAVDPERIPKDFFEGKGVEEMLTYVEREIRRYRQEGLEEGRLEGLMEGRMKGLMEGRMEGRMEGLEIGAEKTKRDNALRMLCKGMTVADVAECVDLPEDEVRRLASETRH